MLDKEHLVEDEEALNGVAGGVMVIRNDPFLSAAAAGAAVSEDALDNAAGLTADTVLPSEPVIVGRRRPR